MGKVLSTLSRPLRNFNIENRAMRAMDRQAKTAKAAPKHPSSRKALENMSQEYPEYLSSEKSKDEALLERLKHVRVDSHGPAPEDVLKVKASKQLPLSRGRFEDPEFGYRVPDVVPKGKISLPQVFELMTKHQSDPKAYTAQMIANDYKLDLADTQKVIQYFQSFRMYVPKKIRDELPDDEMRVAEAIACPPRLFRGDKSEAGHSDQGSLPLGSNKDSTRS